MGHSFCAGDDYFCLHDKIIDVILSMCNWEFNWGERTPVIKRKDKILISAIELLDESGISGLTTKNLAKRQSVSEPALYRQYKNKQEIIDEILEEYARYDEKIENSIKASALSGREAVLFYITRFAELYENYSELTTVMFSFDLFFYQEKSLEYMTNVNQNRLLFLSQLIEANRGDFSFDKSFSSLEMTELIMGMFLAVTYQWRMHGKDFSLKDKILKMSEKLLA